MNKRTAKMPAGRTGSVSSASHARRTSTGLIDLEKSAPPPTAAAAAVAFAAPPLAPAAAFRRRVRLGYFNPDAHSVFVVGSFNNWNPGATPLQRDSLGDWSVELTLPPGQHHYRFLVDGTWRDDPTAQQTAMNPFGGFDAVIAVEA